jgi:hypothetical protein
MERINVVNEYGGQVGWFDRDKAHCIEENTYFNGNNHISRSTNSQWNHEELYFTASGNWIKLEYSDYQGTNPVFTAISLEDASEWLIKNRIEPEEYASLPKKAIAEIEQLIKGREL